VYASNPFGTPRRVNKGEYEEMIIATEKYKDSYIVYIDESKQDVWVNFRPLYFDESSDILISSLFDYSFRPQRLGERLAY
jgi:hypothetical protein